jgi:uncharacterized coiled-coil protein SlyX
MGSARYGVVVWTIPQQLRFVSRSGSAQVSEAQIETESTDKPVDVAILSKKRTRKSIVALSMLAIAINGAAAVCTIPSVAIDLPNASDLMADLLPSERAPAPIPEAVVAVLQNIQAAQQQHGAVLQENRSSLQQQAALHQQDSTTFASLRQSITDEQTDVKKISAQLSMLIAKVDALQNAVAPEITSSIPKGRARVRLLGGSKRMARLSKPLGPVSVGGAPLTIEPVQSRSRSQKPEG